MPANFSRVKDWISEVLFYADLNAEFDNIYANLDPAGIGDYSFDVAQYQSTVSPIDGSGNPALPNSLAGEIQRLRYQLQAILGSSAAHWYDSPTATLSGLASIVFGNSVPATRIESISSVPYLNLLQPSGSVPTVTLKAAANPITYYVQGIRYTLSTDISLTGMSTAVTTGNTATYADAALSGTHASTYAGEHETRMLFTLAPGANIISQLNSYQAYKLVRGGTTEYFTGYYSEAAGSFTATTTSASPTLTAVSSFAGIAVGQVLSGTGIQAGSTVSSFSISVGTITLSLNATASATVTVSFTTYSIQRAQRGKFFLSTGLPSSRSQIVTGDTITLLKLAWIFLKNDNTLTLTYNTPTWSLVAPSVPSIGDFWFDESTTTWKSYSALGFQESGCVYIGQAVLDGTACVAARSQEPFKIYSPSNEFDLEVSPDQLSVRPKNLTSSLAVYGMNYYWGAKTRLWDASSLEIAGTLAASTTYYIYIKESAEFVLSLLAPADRRGDLGGYYHPTKSWRCLGYDITTTGSLFDPITLVSFFRIDEKFFIGTGYIQTRDIADNAVVTSKIPNNAITQAKRVVLGEQISASSGTFTTTSGSYVDVTNLTVTITTTGRPVFIGIISDGDAVQLLTIGEQSTTTNAATSIHLLRGATVIAGYSYITTAVGSTSVGGYAGAPIFAIDIITAGTYTYKVQVKATGAGTVTSYVQYAKLVAFEL